MSSGCVMNRTRPALLAVCLIEVEQDTVASCRQERGQQIVPHARIVCAAVRKYETDRARAQDLAIEIVESHGLRMVTWCQTVGLRWLCRR